MKQIGRQGFSLIEILVAISLTSIILSLVATNSPFSSRTRLSEGMDGIERALRYSVDEAALRNAIVRIHFIPSEDEEESANFAVEYGPNDNFVIPVKAFENIEDEVDNDEQAEDNAENKKKNDLNLHFNRVPELNDKNTPLPDEILLIGIGSSLYGKLIQDVESAIYVYPTGEKDDAIIILASDEELGIIEVEAFTSFITRYYVPLGENLNSDEDIQERQVELANEKFLEWQKNEK